MLRSRIVLEAAAGRANQQIAADLKVPPITVGKWRRSFAALGLDGLRDAVGAAADPRLRSVAKSTNLGLSATGSTRALERANIGAEGGLAA